MAANTKSSVHNGFYCQFFSRFRYRALPFGTQCFTIAFAPFHRKHIISIPSIERNCEKHVIFASNGRRTDAWCLFFLLIVVDFFYVCECV